LRDRFLPEKSRVPTIIKRLHKGMGQKNCCDGGLVIVELLPKERGIGSAITDSHPNGKLYSNKTY